MYYREEHKIKNIIIFIFLIFMFIASIILFIYSIIWDNQIYLREFNAQIEQNGYYNELIKILNQEIEIKKNLILIILSVISCFGFGVGSLVFGICHYTN